MKATNITIRKTIEYLDSLNEPPSSPLINGPTSGKYGESYDYTLSAVAPDGDDVFIYVEFCEDCADTIWNGPLSSGEELIISHSWVTEGEYTIRAQAKDSYDALSEWSTLSVSMPKNKSYNDFNPWFFRLIQRFLILEFLL